MDYVTQTHPGLITLPWVLLFTLGTKMTTKHENSFFWPIFSAWSFIWALTYTHAFIQTL